MKVKMLQSEWGNNKVNNDFHVTLYKVIGKDRRTSYRINIEDIGTSEVARMDYEGTNARKYAQSEFDDIVYGNKTPHEAGFCFALAL